MSPEPGFIPAFLPLSVRIHYNNTMIDPISPEQEEMVRERTLHYLRLAANVYGLPLDEVRVQFDLRGAMAGMYRVRGKLREIRFNPFLFSKYFEENLESTVAHEVAHYVADRLYGLRNIRPHGQEWRGIMQLFDADSSVTHRYDLKDIPSRRHRRFAYTCACREHQLTTRRHNQVQKRREIYLCRYCGKKLVFAGN